MIRSLLLPLCIAVVVNAQARLGPELNAPLSAHLLEVNAQWSTMDPASLTGVSVHFRNETDRIATHLRMVCDRLGKRNTQGLTTVQRASRAHLIDRLRVYADAGVFPQNHVLPYRNPVFIDPNNTACAVGHMMRESGDGALAQRIHDEMNLDYVHDMGLAEMDAWGTAHGFTADELAWVQPGYPPTDPRMPLGGGTDAAVTTLLKLTNGDLLVAGEFTLAGGAYRMHVARWDGSTYQVLGNGLDGSVECAIEQAGVIMVGGSFQNESTDVAVWNGSTWTYSNVFPGMSPAVHALHIHNNELYAAGTASGFAGTDNRVAKLVGLTWQNVGGNMNGSILALASFNGDLIMGGVFTGLWSFGNPDSSIQHVARFDGSAWVQVADGLNAAVHDLEIFNGQLHAGGDLYENIAPVFGLARIAAGGVAWEQLMPNLTNYIYPDAGPTYISSLCVADTALYIGGAFSIASGLSYGSNIATFQGQPDLYWPTAVLDAPVRAIALHGTHVVIGGDFTNANGAQVDHIASLDLATGIEVPREQLSISLWPNPAASDATVSIGQALSSSAMLELVDATGRVVFSERMNATQRKVDISTLVGGVYTMRVQDQDRRGAMSFVKQ
ncbi:MAG: T9SS type A sorting domain-containing protein [Flavobacteriales bacterium]